MGGLIPLKYKERIEPWFNRAGVRVVRDATVAEFGKQGALLRFSQGGEELVPCDSMMVMLPEQRDPAFFDMAASLVEVTAGRSQGFARDGPLFVSECNFEGKQGGKNNVG